MHYEDRIFSPENFRLPVALKLPELDSGDAVAPLPLPEHIRSPFYRGHGHPVQYHASLRQNAFLYLLQDGREPAPTAANENAVRPGKVIQHAGRAAPHRRYLCCFKFYYILLQLCEATLCLLNRIYRE